MKIMLKLGAIALAVASTLNPSFAAPPLLHSGLIAYDAKKESALEDRIVQAISHITGGEFRQTDDHYFWIGYGKNRMAVYSTREMSYPQGRIEAFYVEYIDVNSNSKADQGDVLVFSDGLSQCLLRLFEHRPFDGNEEFKILSPEDQAAFVKKSMEKLIFYGEYIEKARSMEPE
ncbi:hypothetical protein J4458_05470 [Candidatus Woesearchaeota archaeon]|nr:hypothetical protein [Candidatus Woesearchaeota archaeon]